MSELLVALMIRTGIPLTTWLEQPDGAIETAVRMLEEQDKPDGEGQSYSG